MKLVQFTMSALSCALIALSLQAMEEMPTGLRHRTAQSNGQAKGRERPALPLRPNSNNDPAPQEPAAANEPEKSVPELLNTYVNIKAFLCQLGALLSDDADQLERKQLLRLALYLRFDQLPELFSLDHATIAQYFNLNNLKIYIDLCTKESITPPTASAKAKALKKCLIIEKWQQLLGCPNLDRLFDLIVDIYYFEGEQAGKIEKLKEFKVILARVRAEGDEAQARALNTYFNLPEIDRIVDALIAGQPVSAAEIAQTIKSGELVKLLPAKASPVEQHCEHEHLLKLMVVLMLADKPENEPAFINILECLRWDTLIDTLSEQFNLELHIAFNIPRLKALLREFQKGTPLTKEALIITLNRRTLAGLEVHVELIDKIINLDEIVTALNRWRKGEEASLLPVVEKVEQHVGVDIQDALNPAVPEWYQRYKLLALKEHITNADWFMRGRYHLLPLLGLVTLWSAGHAICHPCMEFFEPQRFITAGALALGSGYALYKGARFFTTPTPIKTLLVNSAVSALGTSALRLVSSVEKHLIKVADISRYVPDDHKLSAFLKLIEDTHLDCLPHPKALLLLLSEPIEFIRNKQHEEFITALCTIEPHHAQERLEILAQILDDAAAPLVVDEDEDPAQVPGKPAHLELYDQFLLVLDVDESLKNTLPHPALLLVARHNPRLLTTQTRFMKAIRPVIVLGTSLQEMLFDAADKADQAGRE